MDKIEEIDRQIAELKRLRKDLVKEQTKKRRLALDDYMFELFVLIDKNPGINNKKLSSLMKLNTEKTYNNTVTALRRRGLIINKGSRRNPLYFRV